MGYFPVWHDSRVIIYERKMFIRLATGSISYDRSLQFYCCPEAKFIVGTTRVTRVFECNVA